MSESVWTPRAHWTNTMSFPTADSPGGYAIAIASLFAMVYALLLVAQYPAMVANGWWITSTALVTGTIGTFGLAMMLGGDIATYQRLELDLARTVIAHLGSNTSPAPEAPLAGVWRAYVTIADESRRVARVHAYAYGAFLWGTLISLAAALVTGLGAITSTSNAVGVALLMEFFGFALLLVGAGILLFTVGYSNPVDGFGGLAARRYVRNSARLPAVEEALSSVPWLPEFHRGVRESKTDPTDSTLRWISS